MMICQQSRIFWGRIFVGLWWISPNIQVSNKRPSLVGGLKYVFSPYIGNNNPIWLIFFQRGRYTTNDFLSLSGARTPVVLCSYSSTVLSQFPGQQAATLQMRSSYRKSKMPLGPNNGHPWVNRLTLALVDHRIYLWSVEIWYCTCLTMLVMRNILALLAIDDKGI